MTDELEATPDRSAQLLEITSGCFQAVNGLATNALTGPQAAQQLRVLADMAEKL
jgi:hypothetical protein